MSTGPIKLRRNALHLALEVVGLAQLFVKLAQIFSLDRTQTSFEVKKYPAELIKILSFPSSRRDQRQKGHMEGWFLLPHSETDSWIAFFDLFDVYQTNKILVQTWDATGGKILMGFVALFSYSLVLLLELAIL